MRRPWGYAAVVGMLLTGAACVDDGSDEVVPTSTTVDLTERELRGASVTSDGASIWVAGGNLMTTDLHERVTRPSVSIEDEDWLEIQERPNNVIAQYGPDGRLMQAIEAEEDLSFLFDFRVATTSTGSVLAGFKCEAAVVTQSCEVKPVGRGRPDLYLQAA